MVQAKNLSVWSVRTNSWSPAASTSSDATARALRVSGSSPWSVPAVVAIRPDSTRTGRPIPPRDLWRSWLCHTPPLGFAHASSSPEAGRLMPASPDLAAVPFVGADLAESTGLEQAAGFVVDLLDRPGSDIRVAEGQLGLLEDVVVPGHPEGFELDPLEPSNPGVIWAIDGGSCLLADGRSFQVAAYRASRVRFAGERTDLVEAPPLRVRALSADEVRG